MHRLLVILMLLVAAMGSGVAQDSRKYDEFFLEAMMMRQKGHSDAAFDLLRHCVSIDPQRSEAYFFLAQYYSALKNKEKSLECYEKAAQLSPENETYLEVLAGAYINNVQYDKAVGIYEKLVEKHPGRIDVLEQLAGLYQQTDDKENAIKTLERLEFIEGKNDRISQVKSELFRAMGDKEASIEEMRKLAEQYPNDINYKVYYAEALLRNDEGQQSMAIIDDVLKEEPDNSHALMLARVYYLDNGDRAAGDSLTVRILKNDKVAADDKMFVMRQEIAFNEESQEDSTKIINLFKILMEQPQTGSDLALLYVSYMDLKKMPREAMHDVVRKILSIEPDNSSARLHLVGDAWMKSNFDEVIRLCQEARVYNPDEMKFYYYQGLAFYNKEDKDGALDAFINGVGAIGADADTEMASDFYMMIGDILHDKDRKQEAYAAYDSCLQWNPDNIACMNNYAYFLSLDEDSLDKAEEMSYKTIKAEPKNSTYLDTYAWVLFVQKRYAEAKVYIEQALKYDSVDVSADVLEHAGDIYAHNNDMDKALEYWKQAAKLEPKDKVLIRKIKLKKYLKE